MMIAKTFSFLLAALATLALMWAVGCVWFAVSVATMKPQDPRARTDAIIVLTGGQNRISEGLTLLERGLSDKMFISGVNPKVQTEDLTASPKAACCIHLGYEAGNTEGNASESRKWVEQKNVRTARLVTSDYHMIRSAVEFHQALPDTAIIRHPVRSVEYEPWSKAFWRIVLEEYNKTILTVLRLRGPDESSAT